MFGNLPPGWQVKESFIVPSEQAGAIGKKLGADIRELSNTVLSAHGQRLQANIIEGVTQEDAKKIHKAMLEAHQGFSACAFRDDTIVLEFSCDDINLAIKAGWECGLKPKPAEAIYKISFEAAPLKKGDFMSWNKLFNLFSALNEAPEDNEIKAQIAKLSKLFTFGEEIDLRTCGGEKTKPTYKFKPIPNKTEAVTQGDITRYTFRNLSQKVEVPYVSIEATVTTREGAFTPTVRKAGSELLGPTEFWPTRDFEVTKLAKKITAGCQSQKEKVEAILEWLTPGKNIKFAGPVTGSRYGVKKVLQQGYGHCWDFSDSFVTLCRASGIPCRQVAGWFYGVSGHIWAEVLFEQKGWQQVDPTGGSVLECGIYHIPYLTSENGNMPILYLSMPKIDLL